MISDLVTRSAQGGGATEVFYMHVPANKTGLVIGKGGDTIKQVCATHNDCLTLQMKDQLTLYTNIACRFAERPVPTLSYRESRRRIPTRRCLWLREQRIRFITCNTLFESRSAILLPVRRFRHSSRRWLVDRLFPAQIRLAQPLISLTLATNTVQRLNGLNMEMVDFYDCIKLLVVTLVLFQLVRTPRGHIIIISNRLPPASRLRLNLVSPRLRLLSTIRQFQVR